MINNTAPLAPTLLGVEAGFTKIKLKLSPPVAEDTTGMICFADEQDRYSGIYFPELYIEGLPRQTSPITVDIAYYDSLVENTELLLGTKASVEANAKLNFLSTVVDKPLNPTFQSISTIDTVANGFETFPTTVIITVAPNNCSSVLVDYLSETPGSTWVSLGVLDIDSSGRISALVGQDKETIKFRYRGIYYFSDGTSETYPDWEYTSLIEVKLSKNAPNEPSALSAQFLRVKNGLLERADLRVSFDWAASTLAGKSGRVREFKLAWSEITDRRGISNGNASNINAASTVTTWDNEVSLGLSQEYHIPNVKPGVLDSDLGVKYAFRLQAVAWDETYTSSYVYLLAQISKAAFALLPLQGSTSNIDITDYHIRGSNTGTQTFLLDAVDGSLSLGANSEIDINSSGIVTVKGSVISDKITSADYQLAWLGGVAPSISTSNKTTYADPDPGLWMGYTDAATFKYNIGNSLSYVKWDGTNLSIKADNFNIAAEDFTISTSGGNKTPFRVVGSEVIADDLIVTSLRIPASSTNSTPINVSDFEQLKGNANYTWIKYADSPTAGMSDSPTNKKYIGVAANKLTATQSSVYGDYTWSLIKGADGNPNYTWIKYADSPTTGMSDNPTDKKYIGVATNKLTATKSSVYGDYTWSLIKAAENYTWIKYADSPTTGMSDNPTDKKYIGIAYNKLTEIESTNYNDYTWSLIKAAENYTWIKYADSPTTGMSDNPTDKKYIGIAYNKLTEIESTNYNDYTWSLIKGADGNPNYTWIKYANSPTTGMSDTSSNKQYIGIAYNKLTEIESTNYNDYEWSLIQGPVGDRGPQGILPAPTGTAGLYADNSHLGYHDGSSWQSYIGSDGKFFFVGDVNNYIRWEGSTLEIKGNVNIGEARKQQSAIVYNSFSAGPSQAQLTAAFVEATNYANPVNGDVIQYKLSYAAGGGTYISRYSGGSWTPGSVLYVNGNAIIDGTLTADKVRTGQIVSNSGNMVINLDSGYIYIS